MEKEKLVFLQEKAKKLRYDVIEMIGRFGVGHIGGCMSVMDALTAIYYDKGGDTFCGQRIYMDAAAAVAPVHSDHYADRIHHDLYHGAA